MDLKKYYSTKELADLLGISRVAVFKKIKSGTIKAQKIGRNYVIFKEDLEDLAVVTSELFKAAKNWVMSGDIISEQNYCANSGVFQARLVRMEGMMLKDKDAKGWYSLLTSMAGEIGNNSYDHNIGQWPDVPGIFFGYDLKKKQIVLADRGQGIWTTLKKVRPALASSQEALKMAFTEIISGRSPEARGNGLKYVRSVIAKNPINLIFQTGDARLVLAGGSDDLNIQITPENIRGCLAFISY